MRIIFSLNSNPKYDEILDRINAHDRLISYFLIKDMPDQRKSLHLRMRPQHERKTIRIERRTPSSHQPG